MMRLPYSLPISSSARLGLNTLVVGSLCWALWAAPAGGRLELTVDYEGSEQVDRDHPISVLLFDGPDLSGGSNMIAARHAARSGKTLSFSDLPSPVYAVAIFDPTGNFTGLSGIIPGSLIAVHAEEGAQQPAPIEISGKTRVSIALDDSVRIPGEPESVVPKSVQEASEGIVEIRKYTVKEGAREAFIDFFVEKTLPGQKKAGLKVPGQFRSLENENQFIWIRTYDSQRDRARQLRDFYLGPEWIAVQNEAMQFIADTEVMLVAPTAQSKIR